MRRPFRRKSFPGVRPPPAGPRRPLGPRLAFVAGVLAIVGLVAAAAQLQTRQHRPSTAPEGPVATATVDAGHPGRRIPAGFLGVGVEYPDLPAFTGPSAGAVNRAFASLLRGLGDGPDAPDLRLGGDSTETSWWNPDAKPRPPGVTYDITPAWLRRLRGAQAATGSRLVIGVGLLAGDPGRAAALAAAARAALPAGSIRAFELGNEPDAYATRPRDPSRPDGPKARPPGYSPRQYSAELSRYAARLHSGGAGASLAAPALCCVRRAGWERASQQILASQSRALDLVTFHRYPLSRCRSARDGRAPTPAALLGDGSSAGFAAGVGDLADQARRYHLPVRLTALNAISCGPEPGVSNSFASALWGVDVLFELAQAGVAGVNFHVGAPGDVAAPFAYAPDGRGAVVRPLYYGMLLFAHAVARRSRLLPVKLSAGLGVRVWAARASDGIVRVVVLNKRPSGSVDVDLRVSGIRRPGYLDRLEAPSPGSTAGVTWSGRSFPDPTPDGSLPGRLERESVSPTGGVYRVSVPRPGAALLTLPASPG